MGIGSLAPLGLSRPTGAALPKSGRTAHTTPSVAQCSIVAADLPWGEFNRAGCNAPIASSQPSSPSRSRVALAVNRPACSRPTLARSVIGSSGGNSGRGCSPGPPTMYAVPPTAAYQAGQPRPSMCSQQISDLAKVAGTSGTAGTVIAAAYRALSLATACPRRRTRALDTSGGQGR